MFVDSRLPGIEPTDVHRLRKGDFVPQDAPRKLKVFVHSHDAQKMILDSKAKLKPMEKWKSVYIRPSLPLEERNAESKLKRQIHKLNVEQNGDDYKTAFEDGTATFKFGFRMVKGKPCAVKFERPNPNDEFPKKGTIVDVSDLPELAPLNQ